MKGRVAALVVVAVLGAILAACGTAPEPTVPPPTQTPWIIVVTATPGSQDAAQAAPTPAVVTVVVTATPTRDTAAKPTATPRPTQGAVDVMPSPQASATATPTPSRTPAAVTPTHTPDVAELKYPAPVLMEPPDGAPYSWGSTVLMKWTSAGELAKDEYYHLHLDAYRLANNEHWYGDYVYTKNTSYLAEGAFLAPFHPPGEQGPAQVYWWVRVVRKTGESPGGKPLGVDLSLPSEKRNFVTDAKPSDS